jgi:hypothetical protein
VKDGVPVSDVLQVWMDVAQHPSRGREQADLIWRKILAPSLLEKRTMKQDEELEPFFRNRILNCPYRSGNRFSAPLTY